MVKFSLNGGDEIDGQEDGSGSSNNRKQPRKKQKLTATAPVPEPPPPPVVLPPNNDEEDSEDAERHDEEEEYAGEAAAEEEPEQPVGANEESENQQGGVNQNLRNQQAAVDEKQAYYDRRLTLILTDPDVLDCPICFENLQSPVFQCENGHISCDSCCLKIHNKCPSCSFPIGYNRCRAIEKILETSQVSCKYMVYGCKHIMKYHDKLKHERLCIYSPCSCPIYDCDFMGSARKFYDHFDSEHFATTFHFGRLFSASIVRHQLYLFLKEEKSGTIFVVNQFTVHQGKGISVVQIAVKLINSGMYRYEIKLKDGDTSLTLQSPVECVPDLDDYCCSKHFLFVEDFFGPNQRLKFDIRISLHANWSQDFRDLEE